MEFAEILETIGRRPVEAQPAATGRAADFRHVLDDFARGAEIDPERSRAAYRANNGGERPEAAAPRIQAAAPSPSLDPVDIAFELDLDAVQSADDLKTVRRLFARENHPDRVPEERREHANRRMTIANALIDQAAARFAAS